ncbi:transcription cofactor HES-6 isoform X2 [Bombina bombina]|uniref:transcription cofactor HES-6 isoform X2 n=1 Tax=Bombina bombina TaxID=8345 RepID=UPI00235A5A54|nr:transcription cofactor HES-6 isoform X2 [Bombina bombina]
MGNAKFKSYNKYITLKVGHIVLMMRKPLVEKRRRARINESLQDLRGILADTEFQAKMENAEVLELTVKRVQRILQNRSAEADRLQREASERFAAGYIQCMHEVHTFVSSCPGIDAGLAAELLNHLLESMPLSEGSLHDLVLDVLMDTPASDSVCGMSMLSSSSGEDSCSDVEEGEAPKAELRTTPDSERTPEIPPPTPSMWRPW